MAIAALLTAVGLVWLNDLAGPTEEALQALTSDAAVTVTTDGRLEFRPEAPASTGFIFYPGARVAPEAYAPAMHEHRTSRLPRRRQPHAIRSRSAGSRCR